MKHVMIINARKVLLILLAWCMFTPFTSCKKASEKASEKMIEKSIGNDADVDIDDEKVTVKTDEGTFTSDASARTWPSTVPNEIPKFKYGNIINVTSQEAEEMMGWIIMFENVKESDLKSYQADLEAKNFNINSVTSYNQGGLLTAEKDNMVVTVMIGDGNASINLAIEK
ncbi:MAG: hypothetical protein KJO83_06375 [Bacteroidia bacterium]|nr:hypothetical protein [Bacteroidia bacterium]